MAWKPGYPVITEEDRLDWTRWRVQAKRDSQRARRRRLRRIDWETSPEMREFLANLQRRNGFVPIGHLLDSIMRSWAPLYVEGRAELDL